MTMVRLWNADGTVTRHTEVRSILLNYMLLIVRLSILMCDNNIILNLLFCLVYILL